MEAIYRILTGDEVLAGELIPLSETQRKLMRAEMAMTGVSVLSRYFKVPDGYIDIHMTDYATNVRIHVESGGGLFYDFIATDHVTNRGAIAYDPELYNGGGKVITVDGVSIVVFNDSNTTIQVHGVEAKFNEQKENKLLKFPLNDPALAPRFGKKIDTLGVKGRLSSTGLNGAPTKASSKYPSGTSILTRMHMPYIYNVQAAPEYKWYEEKGKILVVSGLKCSSANTMDWTQEAMGDFPSRKHADSAIDIGGDIDTQLFSSTTADGINTEENTLDFEMAHSCVRTVNGLQLFIVTDVKGDLYVYKTSDPSSAPNYIKVQPPYPSWVSPYTYNARWTWDFNKDGTKMVAVPYNSEMSSTISVEDHEWPPEFTNSCAAFFDIPPELYTIEDPEYFSSPYYANNGHNGYIRRNTPGYVEFSINITVTDMELDRVDLVLLRSDWYGNSGIYYRGAAYEYNTDDLILQTVEAYTDKPLDPTPISNSYMDLVYKDINGDYQIQWTSTSAFYDQLPKIDVIWKILREGVVIAKETLLREFPLARNSHTFTGLDGRCSDVFFSKMYDIYLLANTGAIGQQYFKYSQVIEACDMKSVTYAVRSYDYSKKGYKIISNGYTLKSGGDTVDMSNVADYSIKVMHPEILGYWASIQIKSDFFNFIDTHPDGHMAMCIPDYYQADAPIEAWWDSIANVAVEPPNEMIDYIRLADGSEGTHKDMFNEAFKQNRDYQFYYDPMYLGNPESEYTHQDRGSFAVSGIWRTF